MQVGNRRHGWRLSQGRAFVEDLRRLDITQIESPWPAADSRGSWISNWWSTDQLLARLHLTTKTALDAYKQLVEQVVPHLSTELPIYQLLPARVVGEITEGDASKGMEGASVRSGTSSPSRWGLRTSRRGFSWTNPSVALVTIDGRKWLLCSVGDVGELPVLTGLTIHNGEPDVYSPTPAGSLAPQSLRLRPRHVQVDETIWSG